MARYASPKQISFIAKLRQERGLEPLAFSATASGLQASREIDRLMALPRPQRAAVAVAERPTAVDAAITVGAYRTPDGEVFIVKPNQAKTRLYAKKLVEIGGDRLTEADEVVQIEFEYAPGAIYRLTPDMKMDAEEGKRLTVRYGRCICCGRRLKAAQSVERGIGPVCITYFA